MKRFKHNLSHSRRLSMGMGYITPIAAFEVLPGDSIQQATSALIRFDPLVAPPMHTVRAKIHHWFVPYRLLWDDWENFITGGNDGLGEGAVYPTCTINNGTGWQVGSLADHLGIPPSIDDLTVSALPFRAYGMIYNEHYRDQDLMPEVTVSTASGVDTTTVGVGGGGLLLAAWDKDYLTTARPWPQRGPDVTIPLTLSGRAPVAGFGKQTPAFPSTNIAVREADGSTPTYANASDIDTSSGDTSFYVEEGTGALADFPNVRVDDWDDVDNEATMNDLRWAGAIMRFEEARARWGARYTEMLRYLGVHSSDARLQRPEYLGGGRNVIQFSEVLQSSPLDASGTSTPDTGVGEMYGHGIGGTRSNRYRRFFEEHGIVLSVLIVRPENVYTQNLDRHWLRRTKEDFWQAEFQHVGQQEVKTQEVYAAAAADTVLGYQDRYDEYRGILSTCTGTMRTSTSNEWHWGQVYSSEPTLNATFVECLPTARPFAVSPRFGTSGLKVLVNHSIQARRMVTNTPNPRII